MTCGYIKHVVSALSVLLLLGSCAGQPLVTPTETKKGGTVMGEKVGYLFDLAPIPRSDRRYLLTKSPYCAEQLEELTVYRDSRTELGGAVATVASPLALVFPRIGQPLIMSGLEKSRNETVKTTGTIRTGKVVSCGSPEPAPGEVLFIQSAEMKILQHLTSDAEGFLDLASIIRNSGDESYLNVFIDNGDSVFFVTTIFIK